MARIDVEIDVDIDEVFDKMTNIEKESFINENLNWAGEDAIRDHAFESNIVSLDDYTDDELVAELKERGYFDE